MTLFAATAAAAAITYCLLLMMISTDKVTALASLLLVSLKDESKQRLDP